MNSRAAERKRTSVQTLNVLGFPCKLNPAVQCPTAHISKISKNKQTHILGFPIYAQSNNVVTMFQKLAKN